MECIYTISEFPVRLNLSVAGDYFSRFIISAIAEFLRVCSSIQYGSAVDMMFISCLRGGKKISEALLECSCLHIDYLSSLGALSLTFEKANNRKPAFIFSFVRS